MWVVIRPDDDPHLRFCVEHYTYTNWAHEQRAEPLCSAIIRFISLGLPSPPPSDLLDYMPTASRPLLSEVLALEAKGKLRTTDDDTVLLVHRPHTTSTTHATSTLASPSNQTPRVYLPMSMRPWVLHTCHPTTSNHLGVARTLSMFMRFYWWIGMDISARWWLRRCLKCQARKTSRRIIRWPSLALPIPNGSGVLVSVDYFGPLPVTPRGNAYILLFTDHFSRRADMYAITEAEFTATGTADILINRYIPLWGCPVTLLSDNGLQFCSKFSRALYERLGFNKSPQVPIIPAPTAVSSVLTTSWP